MKTSQSNLLLIFTRNPELGKCKTRLASTIGDQAALNIYKFLLQHTVNITKGVHAEKQVFYSEEIWEDDIWDASIYGKKLQSGKDLGARMHNAFTEGFHQGFEKIIIIGSDIYDLTSKDIEAAFTRLDTSDFIIGPAEDGGYYLLGMKKLKSELFKNKLWGTATVLENTLKDLEDGHYALLETRNDVDLYDDIKDIDAFSPFLKHLNP